jgi:hypothetical protein
MLKKGRKAGFLNRWIVMKYCLFYALLLFVSFFGFFCGPGPQKEAASQAERDNKTHEVPVFRKQIQKEPVASCQEKTDDPLNDWYFSVRLYETPKTFQYLIKMQFEELRGEDTLELPDLGYYPRPVLKKGKDKYSCVVGFLDPQDSFRDYKLVYVKGERELKLISLHHYAMVVSP